jgi:hypothetical protein
MEIVSRAWARAALYAASTRAGGTVTVSWVREWGRADGATSRSAVVVAAAARTARAVGRRWQERERECVFCFVLEGQIASERRAVRARD